MKFIKPNTLTDDQNVLVSRIDSFINSNKTSFTIAGWAGTGKSYVSKYIIDNLLRGKRIAVTAPTHKAVRVIENFTGKKGHTLHSIHGLRPNYSLDDFNIDKIQFESIGNVKFGEYETIFIDESSMINRDLKSLTDARAKQFNTKIVYLGDPLQLPPVKEDKPSDVFTKVDDSFTLTQVIRQHEDNPLLDIFDILRNDIMEDSADFINYIRQNPKNIGHGGYTALNFANFKDEVAEYFKSSDFKRDINFCRYLAYTKDSVLNWNRYIRALLLPTSILIVKNDILTADKTIVDSNNSPVITNSTDYKVLSAERRMSDDDFACFNAVLLDLTSNKTVSVSIVDHTDPSFINYYNKLNRLHRIAYYSPANEKGIKYKEYFNYKDKHLTMIEFNLKDGSNGFVRGYVQKEISYGYGITVHKAQGSTIKNVFLDGLDICYVKSNKSYPRKNSAVNPSAISLRNRLLYTGLSRTSNIAHLLF